MMRFARSLASYVATRMQSVCSSHEYRPVRPAQAAPVRSVGSQAYVVPRTHHTNVRREPESLRGVRRSSVRRDTDAAESLRLGVRRDADAPEECMLHSRVSSCNLRFDAEEPRALDGPSVARRRAPSPLIPSPIYGINVDLLPFLAQFWTIFKSTRPPSKS